VLEPTLNDAPVAIVFRLYKRGRATKT
jgi:hypothetical protein